MGCEVFVWKGRSFVSPKEKKAFWKKTIVFMCKGRFFSWIYVNELNKYIISDVHHWDENNHSASGDSQVDAKYWYGIVSLNLTFRTYVLTIKVGMRTR